MASPSRAQPRGVTQERERVSGDGHVGVEGDDAHVRLEQPPQVVPPLQPRDVLGRQLCGGLGQRASLHVARVRAGERLRRAAQRVAERCAEAEREGVVESQRAELGGQVDEEAQPAVVRVEEDELALRGARGGRGTADVRRPAHALEHPLERARGLEVANGPHTCIDHAL